MKHAFIVSLKVPRLTIITTRPRSIITRRCRPTVCQFVGKADTNHYSCQISRKKLADSNRIFLYSYRDNKIGEEESIASRYSWVESSRDSLMDTLIIEIRLLFSTIYRRIYKIRGSNAR